MIHLLHLENPWDPYLWRIHCTAIADDDTAELLYDLKNFFVGVNIGVGLPIVEPELEVCHPDPEPSGILLDVGRAKLRSLAYVGILPHQHRLGLRCNSGRFGEEVALSYAVKSAIQKGSLVPLLVKNRGWQLNTQSLSLNPTAAVSMLSRSFPLVFQGMESAYGSAWEEKKVQCAAPLNPPVCGPCP